MLVKLKALAEVTKQPRFLPWEFDTNGQSILAKQQKKTVSPTQK